MWILAFDRPYYPSIEEFGTKEEAIKRRSKLIKEDDAPDGKYDCKIYVCEVQDENITHVKTYY